MTRTWATVPHSVYGCSVNPTGPLIQLLCRGSLDARRSSFSTCELLVVPWLMLQSQPLFPSCSELEGLRPPRTSCFCMEFTSGQLVTQLMRRQQQHHHHHHHPPPSPSSPLFSSSLPIALHWQRSCVTTTTGRVTQQPSLWDEEQTLLMTLQHCAAGTEMGLERRNSTTRQRRTWKSTSCDSCRVSKNR